MSSERLRRVTLSDTPILFDLVQAIWQEVYIPIIGAAQVEYMMNNFQSEQNIASEIEQGVHYYFVEYEGKAVGYTAYEQQAGRIYLSKLYIHHDYRGKGIMRDVFAWYKKLAQNQVLYLNVSKNNELAIRIYEQQGFKRIGERCADIGEGYVMDDYIYELDLK